MKHKMSFSLLAAHSMRFLGGLFPLRKAVPTSRRNHFPCLARGMDTTKLLISLHTPAHKKRRRECMCHFGDDDIVINDIRLNPIHVFPASWRDGTEMTFYMDDGDNIYLLTIRNSEKRILTVFYTRKEIRDIVMELPIHGNSMSDLKRIVEALYRVPYAQKLRSGMHKTFKIW